MYALAATLVCGFIFRRKIVNLACKISANVVYAAKKYRKETALRACPAEMSPPIVGALAYVGTEPVVVSPRVLAYYSHVITPYVFELRPLLPEGSTSLAILCEKCGEILVAIIDLRTEEMKTYDGMVELPFGAVDFDSLEFLPLSSLAELVRWGRANQAKTEAAGLAQ